MIQPQQNMVVIESVPTPEHGRIVIPDIAKQRSLMGKVIATGPGKWIPGDWYKVGEWFDWHGIKLKAGTWKWFPGYYRVPEVKVGMTVLFNSKWNDLASTHYADDAIERDMHLVMEEDIYARLDA